MQLALWDDIEAYAPAPSELFWPAVVALGWQPRPGAECDAADEALALERRTRALADLAGYADRWHATYRDRGIGTVAVRPRWLAQTAGVHVVRDHRVTLTAYNPARDLITMRPDGAHPREEGRGLLHELTHARGPRDCFVTHPDLQALTALAAVERAAAWRVRHLPLPAAARALARHNRWVPRWLVVASLCLWRSV